MNGMNYDCGKCKDCINDEDEKYAKLECSEMKIVRVSLSGRHVRKLRQLREGCDVKNTRWMWKI